MAQPPPAGPLRPQPPAAPPHQPGLPLPNATAAAATSACTICGCDLTGQRLFHIVSGAPSRAACPAACPARRSVPPTTLPVCSSHAKRVASARYTCTSDRQRLNGRLGCQARVVSAVAGPPMPSRSLLHPRLQRYRVCPEHATADTVMNKGVLSRFCQQ